MMKFVRKAKDLYWDTKNGVLNIIYYFPVVWKTNSWDYAYCYKLFNHSLKRLARAIQEDKLHERSKQELRKLKTVIEVLTELDTEARENETYAKLWKKYPLRNHRFLIGQQLEGSMGKELYAQYQKEFTDLIRKNQGIRENELDIAFKILRRNSRGWWV